MLNTMTTLGEVFEQVETSSRRCWDEMAEVNSMGFRDLSSMWINDQEYHLQPKAQRCFANRLGIPLPYLERCAPDLQAINLNLCLQRCEQKRFLIRFDGDEVRAAFTPRYKPADNLDVIKRLFAMGHNPQTQVQCHLDDRIMSLGIVNESSLFSFGDDQHIPGVSIVNSEVGLSSLRLSWFILRLVCTNGLIITSKVAEDIHRHVSKSMLDNLPKWLSQISSSSDAQIPRLQLSLHSNVTHPDQTFGTLNRRFKLTVGEKEAVSWGWSHEPGDTLFHIINAYTKGAQYESLNAESRWRLQCVGGEVMGMSHF